MTDVFVSYAREDQRRVEPLVNWLEANGLAVWWDKRIDPGNPFDNAIEAQLDACKVVLVVWSNHSVGSNWVQAEANEGLERDILVPVLIDDVKPPLPFRRIHGAELFGFPRHKDDELLLQLQRALESLTQRALSQPLSKPPGRRYLSLFGVMGAIAVVALVGWQMFSSHNPSMPSHFSFSEFSAEDEEERTLYQSLAEEIAFDLQRTTRVPVTAPDARAIPAGLVVSGSLMPSGLKVIVEDVHTKDQVLARTYASTGDLAQLQGAVTNDLAALVGVSASQASHANPQAYRDFLLASALLREAPTVPRLEQARAQLGAITDAHPRFARAFSRLCGVELRMFRETSDPASFSAAERHCHRAMTLDETDWEVMLSLTDLYRTSGQLDKAIELAQRAEKSQPLSSAVARMLGVVYTQAGHDQAALNALQKALAVEPAYWRNYNAIGEYYFRRGAYADAAHYYALEIDHVRDKAMSLNNLAGALYLQGESTAAVAAWEESISEAPTINALMNLGSVAFFEEEFDSSADYYRAAQALAPQDQRIAGHIADALSASGANNATEAYQQALTLAQAELRINPDNRDIHGDVAAYFAALGNDEAALEHLQLAQTDQPSVDAVYDRALVFTRLQRQDAAAAERTRLIDMGYPQHLIEADANLRH